jgi:arsenical pump membrane protein
MHASAVAEVISAVALAAVLAWAVRRPRDWPEAVAAVPAAVLVVAIGAVSPSAAWAEARQLAPVVGFLWCVLVLARLCDEDGLFRYLGGWLGRGGADDGGAGDGRRADRRAVRLLVRVFAVASVITAVLSLDATVVLLTPVVLIAAGQLHVRARPHAYACGHLANSASLLLPVSNLTNLLAVADSGLSFTRFAALMALPWLAAVGVEYGVIRWFFAADLAPGADRDGGSRDDAAGGGRSSDGSGHDRSGDDGKAGQTDEGRPDGAVPVFSLAVVGATLAGFVVASLVGVNPAWAALGGALALSARALARRTTSPAAIARSADVPFGLFVIALGIVVAAVVSNGLGSALRPAVLSGSSLPALLAVAGLAAVLAAVVNNLPAVLVLLPLAVSAGGGTTGGAGTAAAGTVLAVLIGVNLGPNLTYTGSLATLLWRRVLRESGAEVPLGQFTRLGVATVVPGLLLSVVCLWLALRM